MLYRCILLVIITTNQVYTQSDDAITAQWLMDVFSNNYTKIEKNSDAGNIVDSQRATTPVNVNFDNKEVLNEGTNTNDEINFNPSSPEGQEECITKDNEKGFCVLYFQCDPDYGTIIDDGSTLIDIRSKDRPCQHYLKVCCRKIKEQSHYLQQQVQVNNNNRGMVQLHASDNINCGWNNPALHIFQIITNEFKNNKIYANFGDFPWMIALMKKRNATEEWSRNDYVGGGSLIHPGVVLTAAHKVYKLTAEDLKCRAGEWDTQTTFELFAHEERDVKKIVTHPKFFRTSLYNDIGLLFLKKDFMLLNSPNIGIGCVGKTLPSPGTECFSMGWGEDFNKDSKYAVILKKVRLPLVGAQSCETKLQDTRLGRFFRLHNSLTCAGGESDVDICDGDGGSSLVCPIQTEKGSTRFVIFGIAAYGIGCGEVDVPGVYANVPHLKPWIDTTMASEGYTSNVYSTY